MKRKHERSRQRYTSQWEPNEFASVLDESHGRVTADAREGIETRENTNARQSAANDGFDPLAPESLGASTPLARREPRKLPDHATGRISRQELRGIYIDYSISTDN